MPLYHLNMHVAEALASIGFVECEVWNCVNEHRMWNSHGRRELVSSAFFANQSSYGRVPRGGHGNITLIKPAHADHKTVKAVDGPTSTKQIIWVMCKNLYEV